MPDTMSIEELVLVLAHCRGIVSPETITVALQQTCQLIRSPLAPLTGSSATGGSPLPRDRKQAGERRPAQHSEACTTVAVSRGCASPSPERSDTFVLGGADGRSYRRHGTVRRTRHHPAGRRPTLLVIPNIASCDRWPVTFPWLHETPRVQIAVLAPIRLAYARLHSSRFSSESPLCAFMTCQGTRARLPETFASKSLFIHCGTLF